MSPGRTALRATIAAALIVCAAGTGFALRALRERPAQTLGVDVTRLPAPARSVPGAAASSEVEAQPMARTLPDLTFMDRREMPRRFADWRGRPLLVNFWAPWCSPCRAETPLLEQLSRARTDGVQVIGVAVDSRPTVLRYAWRAGIRYPLLIGTRRGMEAMRALGVAAVFPISVFVDARGRIVTLKVGRLRAAQARLILDRIDALDRGRIDLPTARRQIDQGMIRLAIRRAVATAS